MKRVLVVAATLTALTALAQTIVKANQGQPGTQGPWPVTISGSVLPDGGSSSGSAVYTQPCSSYVETNTSVGASVTKVPATNTANRVWIRICNSLLNTEGAQCICSNMTTPSFAASSLGDPLAVSDCVVYNTTVLDGGVPLCICNGAGTRLPAAECVP